MKKKVIIDTFKKIIDEVEYNPDITWAQMFEEYGMIEFTSTTDNIPNILTMVMFGKINFSITSQEVYVKDREENNINKPVHIYVNTYKDVKEIKFKDNTLMVKDTENQFNFDLFKSSIRGPI